MHLLVSLLIEDSQNDISVSLKCLFVCFPGLWEGFFKEVLHLNCFIFQVGVPK